MYTVLDHSESIPTKVTLMWLWSSDNYICTGNDNTSLIESDARKSYKPLLWYQWDQSHCIRPPVSSSAPWTAPRWQKIYSVHQRRGMGDLSFPPAWRISWQSYLCRRARPRRHSQQWMHPRSPKLKGWENEIRGNGVNGIYTPKIVAMVSGWRVMAQTLPVEGGPGRGLGWCLGKRETVAWVQSCSGSAVNGRLIY